MLVVETFYPLPRQRTLSGSKWFRVYVPEWGRKIWSWLQLKVVNLCSLSCTYVGSRYFAKAKSIEKITNKYYQNLASSQLVWILSSERINVIVDSVDADSSENVFKDQSRIISTSHRLQSNV